MYDAREPLEARSYGNGVINFSFQEGEYVVWTVEVEVNERRGKKK